MSNALLAGTMAREVPFTMSPYDTDAMAPVATVNSCRNKS